ncbi:hypothetical protein PHYPSEUDO_009634 [Phytophthora pseudosyringae]|uniref:Uncharacterized protein n=1 Tax=Phytophthora pseudosyringae TaxID=221518 RepID=A0A8T1WND5_9STRA|nr:hypothetical protein PHYPSEUDO_009634 [Phytophthora pseudosyringae]
MSLGVVCICSHSQNAAFCVIRLKFCNRLGDAAGHSNDGHARERMARSARRVKDQQATSGADDVNGQGWTAMDASDGRPARLPGNRDRKDRATILAEQSLESGEAK